MFGLLWVVKYNEWPQKSPRKEEAEIWIDFWSYEGVKCSKISTIQSLSQFHRFSTIRRSHTIMFFQTDIVVSCTKTHSPVSQFQQFTNFMFFWIVLELHIFYVIDDVVPMQPTNDREKGNDRPMRCCISV